ncbi:DUF1223 domain-containing protein [Chitinophaga agrisoli]|uniref:DUF1223 domain-containing protein n=1 Tax=Chitinophaga agrisoli TaxID=2607653 RepID=A0A5B2VVB8_9BACT|nr:DUF1223 domain-containing protein [Chitinophaga agrisoli]KAA2242610.1 DUF1223 domain-containing protein [Chitinophaga agrisoli]
MRSFSVFIITIALLGVSAVTTAFLNMHYEKKAIKQIQTMKDNKGFAVVELFTSEGCSSCPPADELLESIQRDNKNKELYLLAFHVDYWDHQGWKDRFSDHAYTERQLQYVNWLRLSTAYTPQIVVNGSAEYIGSSQGEVLKAISAGLSQQSNNTLTLNGRISGNELAVTYDGAGADKKTELVLALVQRSAHSNVKGGENTGRQLTHVQVVRQLREVDINSKKAITLDLPNDFDKNSFELVGFVQDKRDGHITAAARAVLE